MRTAILALCLCAVAVEAQAITRYTSTGMGCDEVRATIDADGAAIMRYRSKRNASLPLYGRYVRNRLFCKIDEEVATAYIPAADTASCPVRECRQVDFEERRILIPRRH